MLAGSRNTTTATSRRVATPIPRTTNGKCPVPKDPAWLWARPARLCPAVRLRLGAAPSGPAQRPGWIQPTRSPQCPNARVVPRGPTWHECPNGRDCTQCNTATRDAVEASIEAWRTVASSEHGDGAKPTPMTGGDCTQVQPSVKASVKTKAQRQGPALRLSVAPWCRLRGSVASSEHGDGAKPTPMIGRDCAQVQHCNTKQG